MRRILIFLQKNQYVLVFVVLMALSLRMHATRNIFFSTTMDRWSLATSSAVSRQSTRVVNYFGLEHEIERVQRNNKLLLGKQPNSFLPLEQGIVLIDDTLHQLRYRMHSSQVLYNEINSRINYLTIEGGELNGFKPGMGVCTSNGIIGRIVKCSRNFSKVKSILSADINTPVYLKRTGYYGYIKWKGDDPRTVDLVGVSRDVNVQQGDTVLTFGSSSDFPKDMLVGTVSEIEKNPEMAQQEIQVYLSEDVRRVQKVFVVEDLLIDQILLLNGK